MAGGRPPGSKNKPPEKKTRVTKGPIEYTCNCCKKPKKEDEFYKVSKTKLWNNSDHKVLFCKECMEEYFVSQTEKYGERFALLSCCAVLDIPFIASLYQSIIENNGSITVGQYKAKLNIPQYINKTFLDTLLSGEFVKTQDELRDTKEVTWSKKDRQNKNFVLQIVGYDPFDEPSLTDGDRKHCFNILASYLNNEDIQADGHKIQSTIELSQMRLQIKEIDEFINTELHKKTPNQELINKMFTTKKSLSDIISKIVRDNGIVSNTDNKDKSKSNTLTMKMKEMAEAGFEESQVNLFDIKTSAAMKQIADLSNKSILEQLSWDANDFTAMVKEQHETIVTQNEELERLREENRILNNEKAIWESKTSGKKG